MPDIKLALKIDIDSFLGAKNGVPKLLDLLKQSRIRATFFASVGPDNSGRAILRAYDPRFIKRMLKLGAGKTYGKYTLFYGTLLKAPVIGLEAKRELRQISQQGHEVGLHAYDHISWHSGMKRWSRSDIQHELKKGISIFEDVFGRKPMSFASPGWQANEDLVSIEDELGFGYCSDTRGKNCFYPRFLNREYRTLQVPTTLPTFDELLMLGYDEDSAVDKMVALLSKKGYNVLNIHPEFEGSSRFGMFCKFLGRLGSRASFLTLKDIAKKEVGAKSSELVWGKVRGRYGTLGCQKL